ncbi:YdbH domain-containing protein [uncultured Shewanella sp.]|uniref:YdbH domain-containing protein n=1 Tax=Shewanella atlantica TaxID=271099 RepID=UPI0026115260|nr:YdbH domain-containing protein [uncultured Shewanella sp.]
MLRQLSRAKRLTLAFTLILLTLCVVLASSYERLAISLANRYLVEYDTQITELSITPDSLKVWHVPHLSLKVHDSRVAITDLVIRLDSRSSPLQLFTEPLSLSRIDRISLAQVEVALNPAVITEQRGNLDEQGPALALDPDQLPEIDIGKTSLTLLGTDPSRLSLVMDRLQLDDTGRLNTSLSHQGNRLFDLTAQLSGQRWQVSTSLVFHELAILLRRIPTQDLNIDGLAPLLELQQQMADANIELSGTVSSTVDLNLKTAELMSHHTLQGARIVLGELEGLTVAPHSAVSSEKTEKGSDSSKAGLEFELNGHLADLSFSLLPFSLSVSPNRPQQEVLLDLIADEAVKTRIKQSILALTTESSPQIKLSLGQPLIYSLQDKKVSWEALRLSVARSKIEVTASLDEGTLSLPNQNRETLNFNSKWQMSAEQRQAVSIDALLAEFEDNALADMTLGGSSLALKGDLAVTANNEAPRNKVTPPLSVELHVSKDARFFANQLVIKERQSSPSSQGLSDFSFSNQMAQLTLADPLTLRYDDKGLLEIVLPELTMSLGPISYRHLRPSSKHKTLEFDADELVLNTSKPSLLTMGLGEALHRYKDNGNADAEFEFTAAPFTLESSSIRFADLSRDIEQSSHDNLITTGHIQFKSQGGTRLAIYDTQGNDPLEKDSKRVEITLPTLSLEQSQTELSHKAYSDSEDFYLLSLPRLAAKLEHPSSASFALAAPSEPNGSEVELGLPGTDLVNSLSYEVDGAEIHHSYIKNKRKRKQKLLHIYRATLEQAVKMSWEEFRLDSHENWSIDGLEFSSEHRLQPGAGEQALLSGKLELDTELSTLLFPIQNSYSLPDNLYIDGQTRLLASYRLNQLAQTRQLDIDLFPRLTALNGSINDLPFDGVEISANCHLNLEQEQGGANRAAFSCPQMALAADAFNPGVLITDLKAEGALSLSRDDALTEETADSAVKLSDAEISVNATGDLLGGQFLLPQFNLKLRDRSHAYLVLQGLSLAELLAIQPQVGIYADGIFDGVLPVELIDGRVSVNGGRLAARAPGGLISVSGNPAVDQMRQSQPYLDFAFSTMEHLQYTELASTFDMEPSGDALLKVNVKGRGKGIERPIHLNYSQEENMLQLLKSLQVGDKLQTQIEQSMN